MIARARLACVRKGTRTKARFSWDVADVAVYVVAVVWGGAIWVGNDHAAQAISEPTAEFASHRVLTTTLFGLRNALLVGFAVAVLGVVTLVSGPLTAASISDLPEPFCLVERVAIGAHLGWVLVVAISLGGVRLAVMLVTSSRGHLDEGCDRATDG